MVTVFLISASLIPSAKPGQLHNCRTWKWQFYLFAFVNLAHALQVPSIYVVTIN